MELEILCADFAVCRLKDSAQIDLNEEFTFFSKTDEEISYVCPTVAIPPNPLKVEKGWRGMRVKGVLDFSLIGILSKISTLLAQGNVGIFVISTYDTDYIFVKENDLEHSIELLKAAGYQFL